MDKIPNITRDFIKSVTPTPAESPLTELQNRFAARKKPKAADADVPQSGGTSLGGNHGGNGHSIEYMVEMRIREWMMREQRDREEARRRQNPPHSPPKP